MAASEDGEHITALGLACDVCAGPGPRSHDATSGRARGTLFYRMNFNLTSSASSTADDAHLYGAILALSVCTLKQKSNLQSYRMCARFFNSELNRIKNQTASDVVSTSSIMRAA